MHGAATCNICQLPLFCYMLNPWYFLSAQMVERRYDALEIAGECLFEPAVRQYISSNNVACWHTYLQEETNNIRMTEA